MDKKPTGTFRALSVRNFRLFAAGQVVSAAGTWMMVMAQDWLVLSMTDDSGTALGAVTALQFAPLLLFTLYGGRLADRHDKRRLLIAANLVSGTLTCLLTLLVLSDAVQVWHICLFALGLGTVNAVEVPTRMSFVGELVGAELLPNASALSAAYFNIARVVGPAVAGLLISVAGIGPVMLLNAVSYLATVLVLRMMRPAELHLTAKPSARPRIVDGLRHVTGRPDLLLPMALVGVIGLFGLNFQLTLPLMAKTEFHTDASNFGLLTTAFAAGSLLAALATTARRGRPSSRTVTTAALAFGLVTTAAGGAPDHLTAAVLLALTGFAALYFAQAANHRVQLGSDPAYRGRVMALYTLVLQGSTPLGALLVGRLSQEFGARSGLYVGGIVSLTAAAGAYAVQRTRRRRTGPALPPPSPRPSKPEGPGTADVSRAPEERQGSHGS
ncbi:MFS transporter [Streptomyces sp. NPDC017993]|uniref:MFS transporter n=1 Tax=Streptomyces sp. NPDC017993 TaxID=3365027 RepID=UPI003796AE15